MRLGWVLTTQLFCCCHNVFKLFVTTLRLTASQAIVMAKDDNSVEAALTLIDQDAFKSQKYITEYPLLTALARNPDPSLPMIKRFKSYLTSKTDDFDYYNKLSLVYSTLVRTYCKQNECSKAQLVLILTSHLFLPSIHCI